MTTIFDEPPLRDELRGQRPYGAPQIDAPVRLNTNENPYPVPAPVVEALSTALSDVLLDLNRYPDHDALALRTDLAAHLGHDLTAERVWAANGSNEVQQQLLQAFGGPGRTAMGFSPAYSMHPVLARGTGTSWHDGSRRADFSLTREHAMAQVRVFQPDLVFICSPNNPTGGAVALDVVEAVLAEAPGLVIVDEAYAEFARPGTPSALTLVDQHPRLVVTRTMSKAFGCAGIRLGCLVASPAVVDAMRLVRLPYHLSTLAQVAARTVLAHAAEFTDSIDKIRLERDRLVVALREQGFTVPDSDANFVLFGPFGDQRSAWQTLLDHGVLVRDLGLPGWLRATAGTPAETDALLAAVRMVRR